MIFVYIFVGLIILLLVIAAYLPKVYHIEKTIIIERPVPDVMGRVGNFNEYPNWNPFVMTEPSASKIITGEPGTPGHQFAWKGKRIGVGKIALSSLDAKHIHFDLQFLKPWKSSAKDNWLFEHWGEDQTKVTWENSGNLPWPMARLMGPLIQKNLNHQFETGLNNLKKNCETSQIA